nr:YitT family protein [uncultured Blautia sp.]
MKELIPRRVLEYVVITFAVILMDVGIYVFKFPNNFSFGGVSGMAVVFAHFIPLTSSQINLVINLILLVIGFMILGKDFGIKTGYVTVFSSLLLNVFEKLFPMSGSLTGNITLELCFAIILPALAAAILFFENASGGGTDIVAMIIRKYSTMNISGALFIVDCLIVIVSFMVFDLTTGLCSVLGLMAKTLLIDKSIERMKLNKYFTIISEKPEEICDYIMNELNRSATVYHGEGVYTHRDKKIILTVVDVKQAVFLQRFIEEVDPKAFLMVTKSSEVVGKGFMNYI